MTDREQAARQLDVVLELLKRVGQLLGPPTPDFRAPFHVAVHATDLCQIRDELRG